MIAFLRKRVEQFGAVKVTLELGYRTQSTIYKWLEDDSIPPIAHEKVMNYMEKINADQNKKK